MKENDDGRGAWKRLDWEARKGGIVCVGEVGGCEWDDGLGRWHVLAKWPTVPQRKQVEGAEGEAVVVVGAARADVR